MENKYMIQVPKGSAFTLKTSDDFIALHGVIMACVKRGTGKTVTLTKLLRFMRNENALDRLLLISHISSNKHMFHGLPLDEENDVIEPKKGVADYLIELLKVETEVFDEY